MGISFNNLKMAVQGFKKVALKDTKGVLNKTNNHKWVKIKDGIETTILPSGTKVRKFHSFDERVKHVKTTAGQEYLKSVAADGSYRLNKVSRSGNSVDFKLLKQKTPAEVFAEKAKATTEAINKKRQAIVDKFHAKFEQKIVKGSDGSFSRITSEKDTGKIRSWFKKDSKGNVTKGTIDYFPDKLSKVTTVETPNTFVVKESDPFGTSSTIKMAKGSQDVTINTVQKYSR